MLLLSCALTLKLKHVYGRALQNRIIAATWVCLSISIWGVLV